MVTNKPCDQYESCYSCPYLRADYCILEEREAASKFVKPTSVQNRSILDAIIREKQYADEI